MIVVLALAVIAPICLTTIDFLSFGNRVENWNEEKENWQAVKIPLNEDKVKVSFLVRQAHPYFPEYDTKLLVEKSTYSKEIRLDNIEGKFYEEVYLIVKDNKKYIEVMGEIIDLDDKES